ncbi:MAG TPA: SRPBCC family protein [Trueperaceae bacterium]
MDRSDQRESFETDIGQRQSGRDFYRQRYRQFDQRGGGSMEWGYVATGALLLGLGGYLLMQGMRGGQTGLPMGRSGGRSGSSTERSRRMGAMMKGRRDTPGVQVREQVTINRSVPDLYRFWRNVENLPRVMSYLEEVTKLGDRRSRWVAKGPAGQKIEWEAEITDARENELVAWRSLEGSEVPNEGSVRFSRSPDGSGTVVDVALTYHPPGGKAGSAIAKLFGREPAQEIRRDLERFKERVESGNLILASGTQGGSFTSS